MPYRLAIDTGGTFTDFVLVDEAGTITEAKEPTAKESPDVALSAGLRDLATKRQQPVSQLIGECSLIIHGTTVAINALIQHKGARTGLLCTDGFRDSLEIRLGWKEERFDFKVDPPPVLVPRYLRRPVRERVDKNGHVLISLHEEDVEEAADLFSREGIEAVAICFLWSFLHPNHERRAAEIMRARLPSAYVTTSVDIAPQMREYDRTSTTVVNAYVGPPLVSYLERVEKFLRDQGYAGQIRYVQSNGGLAAPEIIKKRAVLALNSGPAAGPSAAAFYGRLSGHPNLIVVDMGGTSFDACLVRNGVAETTATADVHRYRLASPMTNIITVGAGGGSIGAIDEGILRVGPESAEAVPGPACYMKGGTLPTVTDADMVLGYLNPVVLLGGAFPVDHEASHRAVEEHIGKSGNLETDKASLGVYQVVNKNMANALIEISSASGLDPRDFALLAAGGQGALHAAALAEELSIPVVLIPKAASTFCALGAMVADVRHDYKQTVAMPLRDADHDSLKAICDELEKRGFDELDQEGIRPEDRLSQRVLDVRYAQQIYECGVEVTDLSWKAGAIEEIGRRFHQVHEDLYAYSNPGEDCELINISVTVWGRTEPPALARYAVGSESAEGARVGERMMFFPSGDGIYHGSIYDGTKLLAENLVVGPAVIEEPHTTILVPPGFSVRLKDIGVYVMTRVEEIEKPK